MDQWLDSNALAIAIFVGIVVVVFPRAWRDGQSEAKKMLSELEGESAFSQLGIFWRYGGPVFAMLVTYAISNWYFER